MLNLIALVSKVALQQVNEYVSPVVADVRVVVDGMPKITLA